VVDAANGSDGLRLARAHPFDLIICDLLMPGIDGFTVIAALRDHDGRRPLVGEQCVNGLGSG
jgi:CheY-like chemotaxis protein